MKLTFLGTSHGVPMTDRFCSSALIEVGEAAYLIDGGAPVADLLIRRGIPFSKIRAVFTTHIHSDHTIGLLSFMSLSNWYYKDASYDLYMTEQAGIDAFRNVILTTDKVFNEDRIRMKLVTEGEFYKDEHITVRAFPTLHMNGKFPTWSFVIDSADGKRVVFTGDMHVRDAVDFPQIAKDEPSDAIVCEMAHFGHETVLPILEKCPTKKMLINHIFWKYEENLAAIAAAGNTMPIHAVADGEEIEL